MHRLQLSRTDLSNLSLVQEGLAINPAISRLAHAQEARVRIRSASRSTCHRHSVQIDTPLSSRARALWRSFFLPFYRPTHSLCACLSACSDIYDMSHSIRTLLFYFRVYTERVDESNIKAPTATSKRRPTTPEDAWVVFMR